MGKQMHDILVHLQYHHALMPPYQATPQEVHDWAHEDRDSEQDRNHARNNIILPYKVKR
jgi:hypothetical protein